MVRRSAVGDGLPLMVVQLVGRESALDRGERAWLAVEAGAQIIDLNMGCPAKEVTGAQCGSALMRDLDLAETLIRAAVDATDRPVSLKMRLGWDEASKNALRAGLARVERAGVKAVPSRPRPHPRQQFYTGVAGSGRGGRGARRDDACRSSSTATSFRADAAAPGPGSSRARTR